CYLTQLPGSGKAIAADSYGRVTLYEYPLGSGTVIASCQTLENSLQGGKPPGTILRNMIPYAYGLVPTSASVDSPHGSIPAGGSVDVPLVLTGSALGGDLREMLLSVTSNDPAHSEVI